MRKLLVILNAILRDREPWRAPQFARPSKTVADTFCLTIKEPFLPFRAHDGDARTSVPRALCCRRRTQIPIGPVLLSLALSPLTWLTVDRPNDCIWLLKSRVMKNQVHF
jgi:hypothetical protein